MTSKHIGGCEKYGFTGFVKFMSENVWLSGTVLAVVGLFLVFFGRRFFLWTMTITAAFFGFCACMYLFTLFGWLTVTWSMALCICVSVALALLLGIFIFRVVPFSIGFIGAFAGLIGGALLFELIVACSGYDKQWLLITMALVCCIVGAILALKYHLGFLSLATSFVGGYMFMRGTSYWFGSYPSEMEMWQKMANG